MDCASLSKEKRLIKADLKSFIRLICKRGNKLNGPNWVCPLKANFSFLAEKNTIEWTNVRKFFVPSSIFSLDLFAKLS